MYREIVSDTELLLTDDIGEPSPLQEPCQGQPSSYDVLGFIDQGQTFKEVHKSIAKGTCVGIFPEGGSHDNTDLLPLKVFCLHFNVFDSTY